MAQLFEQAGDLEQAESFATQALSSAPEDARPELEQFLAGLMAPQ
jgi:hypothetical protein